MYGGNNTACGSGWAFLLVLFILLVIIGCCCAR